MLFLGNFGAVDLKITLIFLGKLYLFAIEYA